MPITDGTLTIDSAAGLTEFGLQAGVSYFRKAGVEHDVLNNTKREIIFIEVEIKPR